MLKVKLSQVGKKKQTKLPNCYRWGPE